VAFSFRKKTGDEITEGVVPQPDKARPWLDHAQKAADPDYALNCYAKAVGFDPTPMSTHEAMLQAAARYQQAGGKPASSKEIKGLTDDTGPAGRLAMAEFEWMKDPLNFKSAIKALGAAIDADQTELGKWIALKVFGLVGRQKKVSKSQLVGLVEQFTAVNAWDEAMRVGEMARAMDPSDGDLDAMLKDLSAQRAMDQGGYNEAAGQEGGFRSMVRDSDKQRELMEDETLAGSAGSEERTLQRAKLAYEAEPANPDTVNRYAQLLKRSGTPEAIKAAFDLYRGAHESTGEYRFKMAADDIVINEREAKVNAIEAKLAQSPDDADLQEKLAAARTKLYEAQSKAYQERVERYPTDRQRKYDLGRVQFALGDYEEAMAQFQASKDEPRLQVRAGHYLGRCFQAEGWYGEAVGEFEEAIKALDATQRDLELDVKYDLMVALVELARDENDVEAARKAKGICSGIARRKEVDEVIRDLGG
jgi:tetratricopeptide (TPR) repeat protein